MARKTVQKVDAWDRVGSVLLIIAMLVLTSTAIMGYFKIRTVSVTLDQVVTHTSELSEELSRARSDIQDLPEDIKEFNICLQKVKALKLTPSEAYDYMNSCDLDYRDYVQ